MPIITTKSGKENADIKIQGEFDTKNCLSFKEQVILLIADNIIHLKLDFSETDYIDSSGIGLLLATYFELNKFGGSVIIENPQMHIGDLLEATQVTKYISIQFSEEHLAEVNQFE